MPACSLLIADRLYGVGAFVALLVAEFAGTKSHFLVRVRSNLKAKVLRVLGDGSALVEVKVKGHGKLSLREIRGRVRRPRGQWVEVRFWSDLLDGKKYPASEMPGLYARRWEQELSYKELKVDLRGAELLKSHTPETAAQEIAALILAHAILARERVKTAQAGGIEVLRISFGRTLVFVRALWLLLAAGEGLLTGRQSAAMTRKTLRLIAGQALPKRRKRSCPRAVRAPIGSWPRLTKNTYQNGPTKYQITRIAPGIS